MMPVKPGGFMPGRTVQNKQRADPILFRNGFGHFLEAKLKYVGVDAIDNQAEEAPALGCHKTNNVLSNMIAQIRHGAGLPGCTQRRRGRGSPSTPHSAPNHSST